MTTPSVWGIAVYIKKVTLKNVCCFEDLTLDFNPPKDSGHWAVLLGDNGAGKTTVLRSIAMGLCGETSASALLRELYTDWVRYQAVDKTAIIRIEFAAPDRPEPVWIETKITESSSGDTEVHQNTFPQKDFPWKAIFVCAYGAKRGGDATESVTVYSSVDSVYTLFKYDAPLQNPELILRRFGDEETAVQIMKTIDSILMLPEGSTRLTRSGITGLGHWGGDVPFGGWGDGHRTTFTWVADLYGWAVLYDEEMVRKGVSGIVLIDEIEQHLHPSWQRRIIGRLHEQFPHIQFITTTNSSMCAAGTTDLTNEQCDLFLLRRDANTVETVGPHKPPRGLRADQILTSYLFGLETTRDDEVVHNIERYSHLKSQPSLTTEEQQELERLHAHLVKTLGSGETELQQLVERAVREAIDKLALQLLTSSKPAPAAIDFEIRRQLRELFSERRDS